MRSALDLLLERSPDHPHRFFDIVVPLRPQRFEGIGSFVRFSSSVRNTGVGGQAVVVFDLTRVGGHYFSAVVAKELAYQTLVDYIVPLTSDDERPLSLYIGHRMRSWPSCALVTLSDGEVVTAVRGDFPAPRPQKAEELFSPTTKWRFPEDVPRFSYCESICVLYRERRYLLPEHHHYGSTSVAYVAEKLRLDPHKTVMCAFTVGDLDVQGELANSVIAVAEVPSPANTGVSRDEACDIFVLLDPRPFGLKPHLLFLHHDIVHIPTVVSLLGLPTSSAFKVGVSGGTKLGDRVRVSGNVSLLLFPEAKTYEDVAEESSSSSSVSQLVPPWEDEVEPTDDTAPAEVWGPPPGLTFEGVTVVDPTIPPGQSWNEESADSMPTYTMPVQAETVTTSGSAPPWIPLMVSPPCLPLMTRLRPHLHLRQVDLLLPCRSRPLFMSQTSCLRLWKSA